MTTSSYPPQTKIKVQRRKLPFLSLCALLFEALPPLSPPQTGRGSGAERLGERSSRASHLLFILLLQEPSCPPCPGGCSMSPWSPLHTCLPPGAASGAPHLCRLIPGELPSCCPKRSTGSERLWKWLCQRWSSPSGSTGHFILSQILRSVVRSVLGEPGLQRPTSRKEVLPLGRSKTPKSESKKVAPIRCNVGSGPWATFGRMENALRGAPRPCPLSSWERSCFGGSCCNCTNNKKFWSENRFSCLIWHSDKQIWKDVIMGKRKMNCS